MGCSLLNARGHNSLSARNIAMKMQLIIDMCTCKLHILVKIIIEELALNIFPFQKC